MPTVYSPPVSTYVPLATYTVTGSADFTVEFANIPNTYRDLILIISATYSSGDGNVTMRLNSDGGSNYSNVYMLGTGSTQLSGTVAGNYIYGGGFDTTGPNNIIWQIMDYSATDKHKTTLNRTNNTDDAAYAWAGRWANNNAITTITITNSDTSPNSFAVGSTFRLFGIAS